MRTIEFNSDRRRNAAARNSEATMTLLHNVAKPIVQREEGQDLLEYALLVALIALVAVGAITLAGTNVAAIFTQIANAI